MGLAFQFSELTDFLPKTITQIYGEPASGKTNLCLIAAVDTAKKAKTVVIVDTEGSFSTERIKQIAGGDYSEVLNRIVVAEPADFDEQKIAINKLLDICAEKDVGLIVVDSIVSLYRLEMGSGSDAYAVNRELSRQLSVLMKLAKKYSIPVAVTNQVYSSFSKDGDDNRTVPVSRDLLKYWTKVILEVKKQGEIRIAQLIRHKFKAEGKTLNFKITASGIKEASQSPN